MKTRAEALSDLLYCHAPILQLVQALKQFSWDSEATLVVLTPSHLRHVLQRYLDGALSAQQLEDWANAIECREDIGFLKAHRDALQEVIHQLANPLLTQAITAENVKKILVTLA